MLAQATQAAGERVALMHRLVVVAEVLPVEQLRLPVIGIPPRVPHPMPEKMALARDLIGLEARGLEFLPDLLRQSGVQRSSASMLSTQSCVAAARA